LSFLVKISLPLNDDWRSLSSLIYYIILMLLSTPL
jgi:hypothetical protein